MRFQKGDIPHNKGKYTSPNRYDPEKYPELYKALQELSDLRLKRKELIEGMDNNLDKSEELKETEIKLKEQQILFHKLIRNLPKNRKQ